MSKVKHTIDSNHNIPNPNFDISIYIAEEALCQKDEQKTIQKTIASQSELEIQEIKSQISLPVNKNQQNHQIDGEQGDLQQQENILPIQKLPPNSDFITNESIASQDNNGKEFKQQKKHKATPLKRSVCHFCLFIQKKKQEKVPFKIKACPFCQFNNKAPLQIKGCHFCWFVASFFLNFLQSKKGIQQYYQRMKDYIGRSMTLKKLKIMIHHHEDSFRTRKLLRQMINHHLYPYMYGQSRLNERRRPTYLLYIKRLKEMINNPEDQFRSIKWHIIDPNKTT